VNVCHDLKEELRNDPNFLTKIVKWKVPMTTYLQMRLFWDNSLDLFGFHWRSMFHRGLNLKTS
jgi:hypothetical protein